MDLLRCLEAAATAEIGPRVNAAVGSFPGGQALVLTTDDGFEWVSTHLDNEPVDIPWRVVRVFTRAYRAWFDNQFEIFRDRSNHARPDS